MSDELDLKEVETGELYKWDVLGKEITGILKSYKSQNTAKGTGHVYEVRTKDGIIAFFAPSILHKKLQDVAIGSVVKIKYTEKSKTNSGNELKKFDVKQGTPTEERLKALGLPLFDNTIPEAKDF